jgi:hypothetical protein
MNLKQAPIILLVCFVMGTSVYGASDKHTSDCIMLAPGEGPDNPWTVTTVCGSQDNPVAFTSDLGTGFSIHMAGADVGYG